MTDLAFLLFRTLFITTMTVGMMASLTEFRFGLRKLLCIMALYSLWVLGSSLALLVLGGELLLLRVFFFTISLPAVFLTYWAASDTPTQAVFNYLSQILLSTLGASMLRMFTDWLGLSGPVNILLMVLFYGVVIWLEGRFLRRPFRTLVRVMPTGWAALTLIPCAFCGYLVFMASWPGSYLENPVQRTYLYAAVLPLIIVYIAVFQSLYAQYQIQAERQSNTLLTMQISALKEKLQRVKEVEESIRIQRHDLRHQLQAATELMLRGDRDTALATLDAAQTRLEEHKVTRWCRPPVLDAVFASCFEQAKSQDIPVEASISLPDELPVDERELAIVVANALDNAIHANLELPVSRRCIRCRAVSTPGVMLEISNPCAGDVTFDSSGLPLARREGNGLGVQSISAFCRKNGAVCRFDLTDGWFRLQLVP